MKNGTIPTNIGNNYDTIDEIVWLALFGHCGCLEKGTVLFVWGTSSYLLGLVALLG